MEVEDCGQEAYVNNDAEQVRNFFIDEVASTSYRSQEVTEFEPQFSAQSEQKSEVVDHKEEPKILSTEGDED